MRISILLPTTLIALALSATVGCTGNESDPASAKSKQTETQTAGVAHVGGSAGSSAIPDSPAAPSSDAATTSLKIADSYSTRTTDCTGRDVSIEGQANIIVLTGTCGRVSIGGRFNTVTVETADTIKITGNSSTVNAETVGAIRLGGAYFVTVTWVNGIGGKDPVVSGNGRGYTVNKVSRQEYENQIRH